MTFEIKLTNDKITIEGYDATPSEILQGISKNFAELAEILSNGESLFLTPQEVCLFAKVVNVLFDLSLKGNLTNTQTKAKLKKALIHLIEVIKD